MVIGELLLFGVAVLASWAAWSGSAAVGVVVLAIVATLVQISSWRWLLFREQDGPRRVRLKKTAVVATAGLVVAGVVFPLYWGPDADAALCDVPEVTAGASAEWPDGEPVEAAASADDNGEADDGERLLAGAARFPGNEAVGAARWYIPQRGGPMSGDASSMAVIHADGIGVYDTADGRVKWTLDAGFEAFGNLLGDNADQVSGERVNTVGQPDRGVAGRREREGRTSQGGAGPGP